MHSDGSKGCEGRLRLRLNFYLLRGSAIAALTTIFLFGCGGRRDCVATVAVAVDTFDRLGLDGQLQGDNAEFIVRGRLFQPARILLSVGKSVRFDATVAAQRRWGEIIRLQLPDSGTYMRHVSLIEVVNGKRTQWFDGCVVAK